jgi:hypothetical protein
MIEIRTVTHVAGLKAIEVTAFLLNPTDIEYQTWWKGLTCSSIQSRAPGTVLAKPFT